MPLQHSLFIINIFITKLLEKGAPHGAPFSFCLEDLSRIITIYMLE